MARRATKFMAGMMIGAGAAYAAAARARRSGDGVKREGRGRREPPTHRYGARADDIAGLDAATLDTATFDVRTPGVAMRRRTVSRRLGITLRLTGGVLVLYSVLRRGRLRRATRALGMGLLTRSGSLVRAVLPGESTTVFTAPAAPTMPRDRRRIVDVQKTFYIDAPIEQVYAFWSDYEHFPLFLSHVDDVRDLGEGRSRWSVRGSDRWPIEWTAVLTERRPYEVIAWRSEPGAALENAAIIQFRPEGTGTRLDLRFCYRPLPGDAGRPAVELLGADPGATLNDDLRRLKTLLEATARTRS